MQIVTVVFMGTIYNNKLQFFTQQCLTNGFKSKIINTILQFRLTCLNFRLVPTSLIFKFI